MGVMKISSFFNMDELVKSCKTYLTSEQLNAFDLCVLYCEVRDDNTDFDDMRSFLTNLIPNKIDNEILCKVLKEIWISPSKLTKTTQNNQVLKTNLRLKYNDAA